MEDVAGTATGPARIVHGKLQNVEATLARAIKTAQDFLWRTQHPDGCWCGELEADTTLESDYILMHRLLGTEDRLPADRIERAARNILRHQNDDGGWPIYQGGPSNISATVKAYFGLKLAGYAPDVPALARARKKVHELGGVTEVNTFTKIYLCFLGQYDYDAVPAIPPEIVLFPNWFWFNIYEISSWSRAILVPLSIAYAKKPFRKIPEEMGIRELFLEPPTKKNLRLRWAPKKISWRNFFLVLDQITHYCERFHIRPLRSLALKRAEKWMLERFEMSEGLGAIYPAMLNAIIALRCLGYSLDDPILIRAMDQFEALGIEEEGLPGHSGPTFRMQPCKSPVWDTAYALYALGESGISPDDPRMVKTADWLLSKEVRHKGDWAVKVSNVAPGGWYFEFDNEFYPDVDDSAMVLLALDKVNNPREKYQRQVAERAKSWIRAMQCREGGWASFDKDNTKMVFQYVPFADHNAMLDPPTVDITGRVLEMYASCGHSVSEPWIQRALQWTIKQQEPDGSWFGRWGVNYVYGTMLVLRGLQALGVDQNEPYVQQGAEWLRMVQNPDGGWGETCGSYDDPSTKGIGPSTPSQTAWAVMGLLAAGDTRSESTHKGIDHLLRSQKADGTWDETEYTGTGFPRVFYLKYHMYRHYFPLIALATYQRVMQDQEH